jgi:hypothetical protein
MCAHLDRKYYECLALKEEIKEKTCMLSYCENQITEMRHILKDVQDHPIKEYIKEYC